MANTSETAPRYYLAKSSDQAEAARLDLSHQIWLIQFNERLYTAPLPENPAHVLDLGCGPGSWTHDFASVFPEANVLGIDLTPPQRTAQTPVNAHFFKANIDEVWSFASPPDGSATAFDFIYMRLLAVGIRDWPQLFAQCSQHLKPGAWLECLDVTVDMKCEESSDHVAMYPVMRWFSCFHKGLRGIGLDPFGSLKHEKQLREAGFVDVRASEVNVPVGPRSGADDKHIRLGQMCCEAMVSLVDLVTKSVLSTPLSQQLIGMDVGQLQALAEEAKQDMVANGGTKGYYMNYTLCVAQRP